MFHSARIKLTLWYLVIIMAISFIFSAIIYQVLSHELDRYAHAQRLRLEMQQLTPLSPDDTLRLRPVVVVDPNLLTEAHERIILILIGMNLGILVVSGIVGYFLAGLTLQPIQRMVDEQNRFIADASHELRTPLTAIRSSIEVSLRDKNLTPKETRTLLTDNLEEVTQLQTLSDALLELAQYEETHDGQLFSSVSLQTILQDAVKRITSLAKGKHISIHQDIQDHQLEGDRDALIKLVVILLENAIKYSPEKSTVFLQAYPTSSSVYISVRDEGIGIDPKDVPHIFHRFYRADKSRSKELTPGYGLGLSIAKKIVEQHNGSIEVSETSPKGTTFLVKIPMNI